MIAFTFNINNNKRKTIYTFEHLSSHKNTKINIMINYIKNIYHTILTMNVDEIITKNKFIKKLK
jgi:hypothetical protein